MQCSAARPTSSASAAVRPLSSSTRWNVLRSVAGRHAGPGRGVGVHPLAGRGAGQQLQEDLEVAPGRHDLLDAHDRDQGLGQGQAHPAVALGLQHDQRAGVGDGEVGAGDGDLGPQEGTPQVRCARPRPGPRDRRSAPGSTSGISRRKMSRISLRFLWIAGTRMWLGRSWPSWTISSARSVSWAVMPACSRASLRPISWVAIDLTLTTSSAPVGPDQVGHDGVGLGRVAGPVHGAAVRRSRWLRAARAARGGGPSRRS